MSWDCVCLRAMASLSKMRTYSSTGYFFVQDFVLREPIPIAHYLSLAHESSEHGQFCETLSIVFRFCVLDSPGTMAPMASAIAIAAGRKNRRSLSALRELTCSLITCSVLCFPVTLARCQILLSARTLLSLLHRSTILPYSSAPASRALIPVCPEKYPTVHVST